MNTILYGMTIVAMLEKVWVSCESETSQALYTRWKIFPSLSYITEEEEDGWKGQAGSTWKD
jgi:hypothetical protein